MDFNFLLLDLISIPLPPDQRAPKSVSQMAVPEVTVLEETPSTEDPTSLSNIRPPRPPRSPAPPPPRSRDRSDRG